MDRRTFLESLGATVAGATLSRDFERSVDALQRSAFSYAHACDDIALFGVASDGSVPQWDGQQTPRGILLRWFERKGVSFPDHGYDLYRAPVGPPTTLPLTGSEAGEMRGQQRWSFRGDVVVQRDPKIELVTLGATANGLVVSSSAKLQLLFPQLAWYVTLQPRTASDAMRALVYSRGRLRQEKSFIGGTVEVVARGIERIDVVGSGEITRVTYRLVCGKADWSHLAHFCLPVSDPDYACGPRLWADDEAEAKSRLPAAVQAREWATKYEKVFTSMYSRLVAVATHRPVPPFPASSNPDDPVFGLDPADAIRMSMLDPHVARMLGTAFDDTLAPGGLDGKWYAYKIVGRWACETKTVAGESMDPSQLEKRYGVVVSHDSAQLKYANGILSGRLSNTGVLRIRLPVPVESLALCMRTQSPFKWVARDSGGEEIRHGNLPKANGSNGESELTIDQAGVRTLELSNAGDLELKSLWWRTSPYMERVGILPGIQASAVAAPPGPRWIVATVRQPGTCVDPIEAALDWDTRAQPGGAYNPEGSIFYQVAANQISNDPAAAQPAAPAFTAADILPDNDFIIVPPAISAASAPRILLVDRGVCVNETCTGLTEGWRAWWVRGIDIFGRASAPSPPSVNNVVDVAPPPPPELVLAEYVQRGLPNSGGLSVSSVAREWMAANATGNMLVLGWAWTPELHEQCPDVDGFHCYARRPISTAGTDVDEAATTYEDVGWGSAIGSLGPVAVRFSGTVQSSNPGLGSFAISSVQALDSGVFACDTDLTLDVGAGALTGSTVSSGANTYAVAGNGDGANLTLYLKPNAGSANPTAGTYSLASASIFTINTSIAPPSDPATFKRRLGGALRTATSRYLVLRDQAGTFVVRSPDGASPPPSTVIDWYPAYVYVFPDTGIGPNPTVTQPVASAQLSATSVRKWATRALESVPATPGTVLGVDSTVPTQPAPATLTAGTYCAEIASRPDWYGISRLTLSWTPTASLQYTVYRALGDAIQRLDVGHQGAIASHLPVAVWPADISSASDRAQVQLQFQQLDTDLNAALALVNASDRRNPIDAAYAKLYTNAQRVIAVQDHVRTAYVARNKLPLLSTEVPYVDEFDGRAKARWFYRIASRTPAGIESPWTDPSPPICAPDVVPPTTPQVQVALAANEKVKLRWIASPDQDVAAYLVYRAQDELSAADVRTMQLVSRVAPAPTATPSTGVESPATVAGKTGWLEFEAPGSPAGAWIFRLVAEDLVGNRSAQSSLLHGKSLKMPPVAPVWASAVRMPAAAPTRVDLKWTHPKDARLSSMVERRARGTRAWKPVSEWLPRGQYTLADNPPNVAADWDYRVRVRDQTGVAAAEVPEISLP
jgi:hypothetical protein